MPAGTFVSLYTGCGGLDMGFIRAGFVPVMSNDLFDDALDTYEASIGKLCEMFPTSDIAQSESQGCHTVIRGDINAHVDVSSIGYADLVIGGPPCQGFSLAGKQLADDERSKNVFTFLTVVDSVRPKMFVMENVANLCTNKRWESVINAIMDMVGDFGYTAHINVLNAADFGVPERRLRMILIGMRNDEFASLNSDLDFLTVHPTVEEEDYVTVRDTLSRLPHYGDDGNDTYVSARIVPSKNPILRKSPYAGYMLNGQGRVIDLDSVCPTITASFGGNATYTIDQEALDTGCENWAKLYQRYLLDGGVPYTADMVPDRLRRMTFEETSAIQTFPEWYQWHGKASSMFKQCGNAVPPLMAFEIAQQLKNTGLFDDTYVLF